MMYRIIFSDSAKKQLKKLNKEVQKRIVSAIERIRIRPEVFVTRLVDEDIYRLRAGDYRVLLEIEKNELIILIIKIGHRKNIYK
ncbi:type II toxin-antitoxin system RelE/ParE family toxin [Candidatus Micrarchaeota archaeon]|nr:type II toxin-antitoxin system RelE/ParE family toxin [Candidatus Micrarchaeota archaeon]